MFCGYSKEPSRLDGYFGHPKHMLKLMVKKKSQFYTQKFCLTGPMGESEILKSLHSDVQAGHHGSRHEIH